MPRHLAAWTTAVVAVVGLTACSSAASSTSPPAVTSPTTAVATAPTSDEGSGQSVAAACASMSGPLADASAAMSKIASAGASSPQTAVDTWTELVKAFDSVANTVSNPEVKKAATAVRKDVTAVRDQMKKLYVDKDTSAMSKYTEASKDMQASYSALLKLCAGG